MWIAKIIYDDKSLAQLELEALTKEELLNKVLSFIKTERHESFAERDLNGRQPSLFVESIIEPIHVDVETMEPDENGEFKTVIRQQLSSEIVNYHFYPIGYTIELEDQTEEKLERERLDSLLQIGSIARKKCQDALDLIAGYNYERVLTVEQITEMQNVFSQVEAALRSSRPQLAKSLILEIIPDGILVTEQMKEDVLKILS